ncbi:hypothetical protein K7X08_023637 [Anisodus acutangulus]|uniref:Uncharacterized protein n=1 Tax=Anisodus acutangulus TaxID=402998 RepID=A0A9Q1QX66_9SOLA|nr:hypothetical protein K7X08_023637 [Anisodus acutangulus]
MYGQPPYNGGGGNWHVAQPPHNGGAASWHRAAPPLVDSAARKARRDLVEAGENVSAWKVSQAALAVVKADSWESLGVQMQQVPFPHTLILIERKIVAFIHYFVAVLRVTTLYDLEVAICKNEGVEQFEELELGPLLKHPLIVHYFSVNPGVSEVFRITNEEIMSFLCEFMNNNGGTNMKIDELLNFIAEKPAGSREKLGVRIQILGAFEQWRNQRCTICLNPLMSCCTRICSWIISDGRCRMLMITYPETVEPSLTFILQDKGIIVLNNERGFSTDDIRALCDVGNSTKKGRNAGYIGKKGIGFKSVFRLSQSGFKNLRCLRIVAVEKFYRNVIRSSNIASKKQFECSCLLEGNILYATRESDAHSIFTEISRLFYSIAPDLHLANFLHMITTMAKSGSTEEQIEFFILNSQKMPKLPVGESVWSLEHIPLSTDSATWLMTSCASRTIASKSDSLQEPSQTLLSWLGPKEK